MLVHNAGKPKKVCTGKTDHHRNQKKYEADSKKLEALKEKLKTAASATNKTKDEAKLVRDLTKKMANETRALNSEYAHWIKGATGAR